MMPDWGSKSEARNSKFESNSNEGRLEWEMNMIRVIVWVAMMVLAWNAGAAEVRPGVEVLEHYAEKLAGKRVGILTNPTGVTRDGRHTIDVVRAMPGVQVVRLFAPEHGLRGGYQAGENVDGQNVDPVSGLPVVSQHGSSRKPPAASLAGLDIVLYDIQDVGVRHYTFISSLVNMMEACETAGVEVWVLDRPDPLGGDKLAGPTLVKELRSFIGIHEVPVVYGLTPGEFARLIQRERTPKLKLTIVPMQGWKRGMRYGELGWPWVPPSEHIPHWESCFHYALTGTIGELGMVSEGVGTPLPFEQIGAPWIDGVKLAENLNGARVAGVWFRPTTFKPRYGTYAGEFCNGVQMHLTDVQTLDVGKAAAALWLTLGRMYPERKIYAGKSEERRSMFLKALGNPAVAERLAAGGAADALDAQMEKETEVWNQRRAGILLYE